MFSFIHPMCSSTINPDTGTGRIRPLAQFIGSRRAQQTCQFPVFVDRQKRMFLQISTANASRCSGVYFCESVATSTELFPADIFR